MLDSQTLPHKMKLLKSCYDYSKISPSFVGGGGVLFGTNDQRLKIT